MLKIRVDVMPDMQNPKGYKVCKWVFEKKSGRMLEHHMFSQTFSRTDAFHFKHDIIQSYKEM